MRSSRDCAARRTPALREQLHAGAHPAARGALAQARRARGLYQRLLRHAASRSRLLTQPGQARRRSSGRRPQLGQVGAPAQGSWSTGAEAGARAMVLSSLKAVDAVVIFDEDTPLGLITALEPDVLVKGADYTIETVVGCGPGSQARWRRSCWPSSYRRTARRTRSAASRRAQKRDRGGQRAVPSFWIAMAPSWWTVTIWMSQRGCSSCRERPKVCDGCTSAVTRSSW